MIHRHACRPVRWKHSLNWSSHQFKLCQVDKNQSAQSHGDSRPLLAHLSRNAFPLWQATTSLINAHTILWGIANPEQTPTHPHIHLVYHLQTSHVWVILDENSSHFLGGVVSSWPAITVGFISNAPKLWLAWHNVPRPTVPNEVMWCNGNTIYSEIM